jgi:hypothetical protein
VEKHLSTVAKRKAVAEIVSRAASAGLGIPVALTRCGYDPDKYTWGLRNAESEWGPVRHIYLSVDRRGVAVQIQFGFADLALAGASARGKWNHYLLPRPQSDVASYAAEVESEIPSLLRKVQLRPNAQRADMPPIRAWWEDVVA